MVLENLRILMEGGSPVSIKFSEAPGEDSDLLFCELVQRARFGEAFRVEKQGCPVGNYVLGEAPRPLEYYHKSGRYQDLEAVLHALDLLPRISKIPKSIEIRPLDRGDFDVLILFLKPEKAMRVVQASSYYDGSRIECSMGGIASICGDCTACPFEKNQVGISLGCRGSRKHSKYGSEELVLGIPFALADRIDRALARIPPFP